MKKKVGYLLATLIILLGLIGPIIYTQKISHSGQTSSEAALNQSQASSSPGNTVASAPETTTNQKSLAPTASDSATTKTEPGKNTVTGEKKIGNPADSFREGLKVDIAVVGVKGQLLYGPATVTVPQNNRWGLTALGALDATGLKYSLSPNYGNFVISIAGQTNKGMCGWMYKVNGEVPMVAASEKKVNQGDKIIWWYSESIDASSPTWENLKAGAP